MAQKKYSNGDKLVCPYCGRKGTAAFSHDDLMVVHHTEFRDIPTANDGTVRAEVLVDGCSKFGKMGTAALLVLDNEEF